MNYPDWVGQVIYLERRHQLALMAGIVLIGFASFGYQAVTLKRLVSSASMVTSSPATTHPKPIAQTIAAVPLFGNSNMAADQVANMNLPATNLQLTLRGAVVESDQVKSSAVIEEPGRPAQSYQVGDTLPGNAVLNSVFADHVVLKRNGQLETLNFPTASKISGINIKNNSDFGPQDESKLNLSPNLINGPSVIHKNEPSSPENIKERLQQLQQQHEQH